MYNNSSVKIFGNFQNLNGLILNIGHSSYKDINLDLYIRRVSGCASHLFWVLLANELHNFTIPLIHVIGCHNALKV